MKVWRSPVLYFGIALVLVVFVALVAPFVMDWNAYRAELQAYGQALTGRTMTIKGPVAVRFFPWPRLTMEQVSLANPADVVPDGNVIIADKVEMKLQLAGLFSGDVRVDSIEVQKPVVALLRQRNGAVNWSLAPPPGSRAGRMLNRVRLDQIAFHDGTLLINDEALGLAETLTGLEGQISSPALEGPWKASGRGLRNDQGFGFAFATSEMAEGRDTSLSLRLVPDNGAWPMASFQGRSGAAGLAGTIRLEPRPDTGEAKGDLEGEIRPLVLQAEVESNAHQANFKSIRISPADARDQGTLIEGDALAKFGEHITMVADFSAPRINLDAIAGASTRSAWRAGGGIGVLNGVLQNWPQRLSLTATLRALAVTAGGEAAEDVRIKLSADKDAIRLGEVKAGLPGQTQSRLTGVVFPGKGAAELAGTLALETADLRAFSGWLWPEAKASLLGNWTGARGHLKAEGKLDWTEGRLSLQHMAYDLDGGSGTADISFRPGKVPGLDLNVTAGTIDLDSYLPQGVSALSTGGNANWFSGFNSLIQGGADFEKRVTLGVDELHLNGVVARDVAVDVVAGLRGLEIKKLNAGSVQGAVVRASGEVLSGVDGPDGTVTASVRADDPSGLARLLGLAGNDTLWTRALGQTELALDLTMKPGPQEPITSYVVTGRSGTLNLSLTGGLSEITRGVDATINASASINSAEGADLVRLFGLAPSAPSGQPGTLTFTALGSRATGFASTLDMTALGARAHYDGTLHEAAWPEGSFSLEAPEGGALLAASGLPLATPFAGRIALAGTAQAAGDAPANASFTGNWGTSAFDGAVSRDTGGATPKYVVRVNTGPLALRDVLGPVFLPWNGGAPGVTSVLAPSLPKGESLEVWLTPKALTLAPGVAAREAEVGISLDPAERRLVINGRDGADNSISLDLSTMPDGEVQNVAAQFTLPVVLAEPMALADGTAVMDGTLVMEGKVAARGRSAMAVISSMSGSGSYRLADGALKRLSPQLLGERLVGVADAAGLNAALDAVRSGPGLALGAAKGGFTVKDGIASLDAMNFTVPGATVALAAAADFGAAAMDATVTVSPADGSELPPYAVTYAGEPGALAERDDFGALASKFGVKLLQQGVAELERAQKEQEKLAAEEAAQRAADQVRFAEWQATRAELRQRQREIRIQAELRAAAPAPPPAPEATPTTRLTVTPPGAEPPASP